MERRPFVPSTWGTSPGWHALDCLSWVRLAPSRWGPPATPSQPSPPGASCHALAQSQAEAHVGSGRSFHRLDTPRTSHTYCSQLRLGRICRWWWSVGALRHRASCWSPLPTSAHPKCPCHPLLKKASDTSVHSYVKRIFISHQHLWQLNEINKSGIHKIRYLQKEIKILYRISKQMYSDKAL